MKINWKYLSWALPIIIPLAFIIPLLIWVVNDSNCKGCPERNIGIIKAIIPHSSSFNSKTEIQTEKQFYVVLGFPQLQIGDSLMVRIDQKRIALLRDDTGQWFKVIHNTGN